MKRFTWLATAVALAAFAAPATAQDMPMRFGVIGGVNFADVGGDDVEDTSIRTAFDVGALAQFPLGMVLTFQPEVRYTQWGTETDDGFGTDIEFQLSYIHVPLLLRAGTALAEGFDVDLLVGPYAAFAVGCDVEDEDGNSADCEDLFGDLNTDWGLTVGAGFSWGMGMGDLMVDGRYNLGFADHFDDSDTQNRVFQVLVGYAFPFGM